MEITRNPLRNAKKNLHDRQRNIMKNYNCWLVKRRTADKDESNASSGGHPLPVFTPCSCHVPTIGLERQCAIAPYFWNHVSCDFLFYKYRGTKPQESEIFQSYQVHGRPVLAEDSPCFTQIDRHSQKPSAWQLLKIVKRDFSANFSLLTEGVQLQLFLHTNAAVPAILWVGGLGAVLCHNHLAIALEFSVNLRK